MLKWFEHVNIPGRETHQAESSSLSEPQTMHHSANSVVGDVNNYIGSQLRTEEETVVESSSSVCIKTKELKKKNVTEMCPIVRQSLTGRPRPADVVWHIDGSRY